MRVAYKRGFLKAFDKSDSQLQRMILETVREIRNYLEAGQAPYGLRVKKISERAFEGRVSDKVRMVWVKEKDLITFVMVGNHEEVQNYLRNFCQVRCSQGKI